MPERFYFFATPFRHLLSAFLGDVGWAPTVELTVHIRQRPAPGWILGEFKTDHLAGGRMIESGALWDFFWRSGRPK